MLVFSVYIPFLISRVRPVHSIFEKKSILENPSQIFTNLFFHAYMAYMPSFFAWLFRPAFKDNKVISSFSTFLRLLLSFFDIPRIISRFSESLAALRIPSLPSAPLLLFLFSDFRASWCSPHRFFFIFSCVSYSPFFLSCSLFFLLSHLTFPAYLSLLFHYPRIDSEQCDNRFS